MQTVRQLSGAGHSELPGMRRPCTGAACFRTAACTGRAGAAPGASEQHSASWEFGAGVTGGPSTPPPPSYGEPRYQRQAAPAPAPKAEDEPEQPVKTLEWLWSLILTAIPIVNLVVLLIWSFGGGTSITKRNWARAKLILVAVGTAIGVILCIALFGMIAYFTGFGYGGFGHGGYGYGFDTPFYYY